MARDRTAPVLDDASFGPLTEPLRRDLLLHCYRFTGSVHDAEDLVQETLARAWRGRAGYRGEAGLRTWLRRIATRVCLDAQRQQHGRRALPSAVNRPNRGEVLWLEPLPDHLLADVKTDPAAAYDLRESVSLAFLTALRRHTHTDPPTEGTMEIVEFDPGRAMGAVVRDMTPAGPLEMHSRLTVEPMDGKLARVTAYIDVPVMQEPMDRTPIEASLARMKELIESETAEPSSESSST